MPTPQRIISDMKEGLDTLMLEDSEKEGLKRLRSCIGMSRTMQPRLKCLLACILASQDT